MSRQYSICYSLTPAIYSNIIRCLNEGSSKNLDPNLFDSDPCDRVCFTIKNYKTEAGLSGGIHTNQRKAKFRVSGPYGKGLMVKPTGEYIIFCAGTGILCYLDLLTHLALSLLESKGKESSGMWRSVNKSVNEMKLSGRLTRKSLVKDQPEIQLIESNDASELIRVNASDRIESSTEEIEIDPNNFRLTMYASFFSYRDVIGYKLMEALHKYCERNRLNNFKLVLNLSEERLNNHHWDEEYLKKELIKSKKFNLE